MKSFVLSAMICAAAVGTSMASTNGTLPEKRKKEQVSDQQRVAAFKQVIQFHQHNVDVLFNQFELAKKRIRQSHGCHADLEREKASFIEIYQNDIDQGVRVEASKKAIEEIQVLYADKHSQRDAYETEQIAKLQARLQAELERERKHFQKTKRKYAGVITDEVLPLLTQATQYFAKAIDRAQKGDS